jgi:HD-GYP domain-containing protein (c-di-GMP phosphodiesterase class II)
MKKISIQDLHIGMFVEQLDRPWVETPAPFQGMLIETPKEIAILAKYCQYVFVSAKENAKKMYINDLEVGMFVVELDRPCFETPFPIQGMLIQNSEDISELGKYCEYVYITHKDEEVSKEASADRYASHIIPEDTGERTPFHGQEMYIDTHSFDEEIPIAKKAREKASNIINQIKLDIDRGSKLDLGTAKELVNAIAISIIKNPAAMLFLNQLNLADASQYQHVLNVSVHMIAFGRHLCLPTDELYILGLGGLLMDIGLITQTPDSKANYSLSEKHVFEGVAILSQIPSIPHEVIEITLQHHERENGKGYPHNLSSGQISIYARMAAIVDIYECLISKGLKDIPPASPFEALTKLWDMARSGLNATLVKQFAHCVGLFPIGSLVELNTGEVGIVITQSRTNRLLPTIMLVLDKSKQPRDSLLTVDLANQDKNKSKFEIVLDLKPGAYGIDPQEYYL